MCEDVSMSHVLLALASGYGLYQGAEEFPVAAVGFSFYLIHSAVAFIVYVLDSLCMDRWLNLFEDVMNYSTYLCSLFGLVTFTIQIWLQDCDIFNLEESDWLPYILLVIPTMCILGRYFKKGNSVFKKLQMYNNLLALSIHLYASYDKQQVFGFSFGISYLLAEFAYGAGSETFYMLEALMNIFSLFHLQNKCL